MSPSALFPMLVWRVRIGDPHFVHDKSVNSDDGPVPSERRSNRPQSRASTWERQSRHSTIIMFPSGAYVQIEGQPASGLSLSNVGLGDLCLRPNIRKIHLDLNLILEVHDFSCALNFPPPAVNNIVIDWIAIMVKVAPDLLICIYRRKNTR